MKRVETPKLDVTPYVGVKAQIVSAEVIQAKHGPVIKVVTNPIDLKGDDKLPEGKHLTGSIMLGLLVQEDESLAIGIDSKADKFLKAHKVDIEKDIPDDMKVGDQVKSLLGKEVVLQKNENNFLEIA